MIERFFQNRPKLAVVLAVVLAIGGLLAARDVQVADYPELTPPRINVSTSYTGASPDVIADTVATPIEDQVNGVDNVQFFESTCYDTGSYSLSVVFEPGTNPDIDLVNVQNAVKRAEPKLPAEVTQVGLTIAKVPSDYILRFAFTTDDSRMDGFALGNFVTKEIKDALQRVPGVSNVTVSDREYAMRVWIDPARMDALGISVADVKSAIAAQNIQPAAGFIGNAMSSPYLSYKINVRGRLVDESEFDAIVVRSEAETGSRVLLRDIARCELGSKVYNNEARLDGEIVYLTCVYADPKANSKTVIRDCKAAMAEWEKRLPEGVKMTCIFDKSIFTDTLLGRIGRTGLWAVVIAALVAALLCRSGRLAFVSVIAVPFAILGAALFLWSSRWTLDAFTALSVLLAVGAILFNGLVAAEGNASGVILPSFLVTVACYLPLAFHGGMIGMMYVRFAATLCAVVGVSAFLSVSLTASVARTILAGATPSAPGRRMMSSVAAWLAAHRLPALTAYAVGVTLCLWSARFLTRGFMPDEDRGYLKAEVELSEGSSMKRTNDVVARMYELLKDVPGLKHVLTSSCSSVLGKTGENHAEVYFTLEAPDERPGLSIDAIVDEIERRLKAIAVATFTVMKFTPINGMGGYGGVAAFPCVLGDVTPQQLEEDMGAYARKLERLPCVHSLTTTFSASTPQLHFSVDRDKAYALGVRANDIFVTMQSKLASFYVNDFNIAGGTHQVVVQNTDECRDGLDDAMNLRFPGANGEMVPLSAVGRFEYVLGPRVIPRYNKMTEGGIVIAPAEGSTSLDVVEAIEKDPPDPRKYKLEWSPMTREEISTRDRLPALIAFAVMLAYFVLVATFESWIKPIAVLIPSVVAVAGGVLGLWLTGLPLTIYAQLGLLLLIEFPIRYSILLADRDVERAWMPILVSSLGFSAALVTLLFARGVGANTLQAVAVPVLSGVLSALVFGVPLSVVLQLPFTNKREISG